MSEPRSFKAKMLSAGALETLKNYDSSTISNVIELFKIRPNISGYMNASIRAIYPKLPPVVGYATTATFRAAYPSIEANVYRRSADYIERMQEIPEPRMVVVQDLDEPQAAAVLGEVMSRLYRRFGCAGFITNGATRDLLQVEKLDFAVFASSVIVSHGYPHLEEIHVPVHVGGLTVRPGDLLHADANGVVLIPSSIAEMVAEACEEFCAAEGTVMEYLEGENVTPHGYRGVWEKTKKQMEELSEKVRKELAEQQR
ncbi:MAG: RraA family protein [Acidobacteriia bacterium]|nr:RraA family protein [Terriglobia bacterium]